MFLNTIHINTESFPNRLIYPFNLPFLNKSFQLEFTKPVTFFAGENGSGKSTLLKAIARSSNIHIWQNEERSRTMHNPYEQTLCRYIQPDWTDGPVTGSFFGSDIFNHFAEILDSWASSDPKQLEYFGGRSLTTLSHGQSLMAFFKNRYKIKGLYLLDEPETALSPKTQLELLKYLNEISESGHAQFIIASHSPIIMACKNSVIYNFDEPMISPINYEKTNQFLIYSNFIKEMEKGISNS